MASIRDSRRDSGIGFIADYKTQSPSRPLSRPVSTHGLAAKQETAALTDTHARRSSVRQTTIQPLNGGVGAAKPAVNANNVVPKAPPGPRPTSQNTIRASSTPGRANARMSNDAPHTRFKLSTFFTRRRVRNRQNIPLKFSLEEQQRRQDEIARKKEELNQRKAASEAKAVEMAKYLSFKELDLNMNVKHAHGRSEKRKCELCKRHRGFIKYKYEGNDWPLVFRAHLNLTHGVTSITFKPEDPRQGHIKFLRWWLKRVHRLETDLDDWIAFFRKNGQTDKYTEQGLRSKLPNSSYRSSSGIAKLNAAAAAR